MSDPKARMSWKQFKALAASDLSVNGGGKGFGAGASAFLFHPGFQAIFLHRLAQFLKPGWPRLSLLVWRTNVAWSGCHFHPECEIGPQLTLPHPVGIVVGSSCRLGRNVTLYQNTTIGRSSGDRYPSIDDNVVIYPNAVVIGPVEIGDGAIIGASSVVLSSVEAGATVAGNPAAVIRKNTAS
jgi:serine O-acetyltransferase